MCDRCLGWRYTKPEMCWLCWGLGWLSAPVCIHAKLANECRFPHRITHSSFYSYSLLHSFPRLSWRVVITYQSLTYQACTLFISFELFSAGMMRIFYRLGFVIFILNWFNKFLIRLSCNITFKFFVDRNEAVLSISRTENAEYFYILFFECMMEQ